ncbi:hypothetical protein [Pseudomonas sp. TNT3]|uniref:hypothetical protein n=1 Tax=Pseudomonas sp. TNT3 TaxID=2654097 RepID=UPI0013909D12|nr:hypothetical protein [Pseudomonas sp. TNT3]KAI2693250.1 hypothetical protein GBC55_006910 [Pseudomonas sp. TNT3]
MVFGSDREKLNLYLREFESESDRGCAVLMLCALEDLLLQAIRCRLPECSNEEFRNLAPLGRLSLTISNAFVLGVLSERERADFLLLVKVRNKFAHGAFLGLSFLHDDVVHLCNFLKLCDSFDDFVISDPRKRFMFSSMLLYLMLHDCSNDKDWRLVLKEETNYVIK